MTRTLAMLDPESGPKPLRRLGWDAVPKVQPPQGMCVSEHACNDGEETRCWLRWTLNAWSGVLAAPRGRPQQQTALHACRLGCTRMLEGHTGHREPADLDPSLQLLSSELPCRLWHAPLHTAVPALARISLTALVQGAELPLLVAGPQLPERVSYVPGNACIEAPAELPPVPQYKRWEDPLRKSPAFEQVRAAAPAAS